MVPATGNGWFSAGDYFNLDYGAHSGAVNLNVIVSKYWLVGSYHSNLGSLFSNNANPSAESDHFKLQGATVLTAGLIK